MARPCQFVNVIVTTLFFSPFLFIHEQWVISLFSSFADSRTWKEGNKVHPEGIYQTEPIIPEARESESVASVFQEWPSLWRSNCSQGRVSGFSAIRLPQEGAFLRWNYQKKSLLRVLSRNSKERFECIGLQLEAGECWRRVPVWRRMASHQEMERVLCVTGYSLREGCLKLWWVSVLLLLWLLQE